MIALPAEVTFATAPRVLDDAAQAIDADLRGHGGEPAEPGGGSSAAIDVDLGGCSTFDSSLLAVLLELMRRARAVGAGCRLHRAPSNLHKLAALYGVDELLFTAR